MAIKVNCVMLALFGNTHTTQDQFEKIREEFKEVEVAYRNYKHTCGDIPSMEHLKTELYDLMQASYHMLEILDSTDADNEKHLRKIEKYINSGRIKN